MRCRFLHLALTTCFAGWLPAASGGDVTAEKGKDAVEFKVGGEPAGRYQFAGTVPDGKGGEKPLPKPVVWPLTAPGGTPVTAFAPKDHIHHKSVWFCHGDVIPEGVELKKRSADKHVKGVDFWSEAANHGRIVCVKVGELTHPAKDHAAVTTWNEWKTPDGVTIIDEERTIHLRDLGAGRLFVFEITLTATAGPVQFGDTKEGSFGIRVNQDFRAQLPAGGTITTAGGQVIKPPAKDDLSVWGRPADWNDYAGVTDGKAAGVAVFDHPDNPRAAWHTRAYGLMAANPFGRAGSGFPSQHGKTDLVRIEKGKSLKLRYGVYAHTGDAKTGKVAEAYEVFKK